MIFLLFSVAAFCLLGGLVAIGVSLQELDRRLAELATAMDGRYGTWMERSAEERRLAKAARDKNALPASKPAPAASGPKG
jgi:hypothetical protein